MGDMHEYTMWILSHPLRLTQPSLPYVDRAMSTGCSHAQY